MAKNIEIIEYEWYIRDHLFRQFNKGRLKFQKQELVREMSNLYLRYRNSDLKKLNELTDIVIENLICRQVLQLVLTDGSLQLACRLSRLQCANCYYISYLSSNESTKCLRCSSVELHDFPHTRGKLA